MPELPEVETIRRHLIPDVVGCRIERVDLRGAHAVEGMRPAAFAAGVRARTVDGIWRRGKYLVWTLTDPGGSKACMVVHLRMTGRLSVLPSGRRWLLPLRHTHAVFHLRRGAIARRLFFYDVRKFGRLWLCNEQSLSGVLPAGRDPVVDGLDGPTLAGLLGGRTAPLKSLLLRQDLVCGLGNIYADEALHRAGLHPTRRPPLEAVDWSGLSRAIVDVLHEALAFEGTTLFDYRRPDGEPGAFGQFLRVYGRAGRPCRTCGADVTSRRIAGRTTSFCPICQPEVPDVAAKAGACMPARSPV